MKPQKHTFSFYFLNIPLGGEGGGPKKVEYLLTSPINQFQDHSHQNRLGKCSPGPICLPQVSKKYFKKSTKHFSKPDC